MPEEEHDDRQVAAISVVLRPCASGDAAAQAKFRALTGGQIRAKVAMEITDEIHSADISPERSGSGRGVPVPSMTICVVGSDRPRVFVCPGLIRVSQIECSLT